MALAAWPAGRASTAGCGPFQVLSTPRPVAQNPVCPCMSPLLPTINLFRTHRPGRSVLSAPCRLMCRLRPSGCTPSAWITAPTLRFAPPRVPWATRSSVVLLRGATRGSTCAARAGGDAVHVSRGTQQKRAGASSSPGRPRAHHAPGCHALAHARYILPATSGCNPS